MQRIRNAGERHGKFDIMIRRIAALVMAGTLAASAAAQQIPEAVGDFADAFERTQTVPEKLRPGRTLREEYAANFFMGLTHPEGAILTRSALMEDAYLHGQAFWRDNPSGRDAIMSEYGYVAVKREGVWSRGFEISAFEPVGASRTRWWMSSFGNVAWSALGLDAAAAAAAPTGVRVRIVGYLSPAGRHGHLGAYEREVLVTSSLPAVSANN
jgi:hypothetical protein